MKPPVKAEIEVLQKALREIKSLSYTLTPEDPKQLETNLGDLESKISALRSFIWNQLMREEIEKQGH